MAPLCPLSYSFWSDSWWLPDTRLPALGADKNTMTVGGYSGGAAYAQNFQIVFSKDIKGTGCFAGDTFGHHLKFGTFK